MTTSLRETARDGRVSLDQRLFPCRAWRVIGPWQGAISEDGRATVQTETLRARLHTALAHVAATALASDGGEWAEVVGSRYCTAAVYRRDEPPGVRQQGSQHSRTLHELSQIPGSGYLLTQFATQRVRAAELTC